MRSSNYNEEQGRRKRKAGFFGAEEGGVEEGCKTE